MARRRRSSRLYRPIKTMKYSNETVSGGNSFNQSQVGNGDQSFAFPIVNPESSFGMRKAKNFTVRCSLQGTQTTTGQAVCALIYLPEGLNPAINLRLAAPTTADPETSALSLYEPSQNVISSWIMNYDTSFPLTISSRLARNLNSGDSVWLVIAPLTPVQSNELVQFGYVCNFALGYN